MQRVDAAPQPFIKGILGIRSTLLFVRRNLKRIAVVSASVFLLGCLIAALLPNKYQATALVLVDPREQKVTTEQEVLPGIGQDSAALQSLVEIATSDGFLRPVFDQLKVASDGEIASGESDPSRILDNFRKRLEVTRRGLTYVIAFSFTSNDPIKAARYANAVAEAFAENQGKTRTGATVEAAGFLNERLKTLREAVKTSEDAVAAFRAQHKMIDAGKESTTRQLRVTELTSQVAGSRQRAEEAKARLDQAQRDLSGNVDATATSRTDLLGLLRAQRASLVDQIAQKKAVFGERHPDLVIANAQLADLNRQIDAERRRVIDTARSDLSAIRAQLTAQEQQLKEAETETLSNDEATVKLRELQRDADANRNIFEQFLARYKSTSEQRLFQSGQVQVASPAQVPTRPMRSFLIVAAALAVGSLLTGFCYAAVAELLDQRIRTATQLEDGLGLPVWSLVSKPSSRDKTNAAMQNDVAPLLHNIFRYSDGSSQFVLVTAMDDSADKGSVARALCELAIAQGVPSVLLDLTSASPNSNRRFARSAVAADGTIVPHYLISTDAQSVMTFLEEAQSGGDPFGFGDIQDDFGLVVIDAPVLSVRHDVAQLAGACDLTVLVAGWEKTTLASIKTAQSLLANGGDASAVAVITQIDADRYALFDPDAADTFTQQQAA
jgi:uncharacterized protein involved in exopolysaccharide biosynthesis